MADPSRNPDFNRDRLAAALGRADITYVWLGETLGNPKDASGQRTLAGFEAIMKEERYEEGMARLLALVRSAKGGMALTCAEASEVDCHRKFILQDLRERLAKERGQGQGGGSPSRGGGGERMITLPQLRIPTDNASGHGGKKPTTGSLALDIVWEHSPLEAPTLPHSPSLRIVGADRVPESPRDTGLHKKILALAVSEGLATAGKILSRLTDQQIARLAEPTTLDVLLKKKGLGALAERIRREETKLTPTEILLLNLSLLSQATGVRDKILARLGLGTDAQIPGTNGVPIVGPASGVPAQNVLRVAR